MSGKQTAAPAGKPAPKAASKPAPKAANAPAAPKAAPKKATKLTALAATAEPIIINNEQLAAASKAWLDAVAADNLNGLFKQGTLLYYVTLPATTAAKLLVKEAVYLKARFVVYDMPAGQSQFTVALCPADTDYNNLLTGWYLCDSTWNAPSPPPPLTVQVRIPYEQAAQEMTAWLNTPEIAPPLFMNSYGTLQGYNFEISDLSNAISSGQPVSKKFLRMCFGLDNKGQTFMLILRVQAAGGTAGSEVPCYDMAAAVPPARP